MGFRRILLFRVDFFSEQSRQEASLGALCRFPAANVSVQTPVDGGYAPDGFVDRSGGGGLRVGERMAFCVARNRNAGVDRDDVAAWDGVAFDGSGGAQAGP